MSEQGKVWLTRLLLVAILLVATYFRTLSLFQWDGGTGQHPDERFLARVTSEIRIPATFGEYFDAYASPANPRNMGQDFYVYGVFPSLLTRLVAVVLTPEAKLPPTVEDITAPPDPATRQRPQIPNPERDLPTAPPLLMQIFNPEGEDLTAMLPISHVGRALVVVFDVGTVLLVFLLGRRVFNRRVGLLAALFSALTVFQIQQAHFFVDPAISTFFVVLALYWGVRAAQGGGVVSFTFLGISIGLAMANRVTLVALAVVVVVAAVQATRVWYTRRQASGATTVSVTDVLLTRTLPLVMLAGVVSFVVFRLFQPYAFMGSSGVAQAAATLRPDALDWMRGWGFLDLRREPRFFRNMWEIQFLTSGQVDFPPSLQWVNRTAYLFPLKNMVLWGMGPFLGVAAWVGWLVAGGWMAWRWWQARTQPQTHALTSSGTPASLHPPLALAVLWVWVGIYFAWQGNQFAMTMRYMLPITGALSVFAAWVLVYAVDVGWRVRVVSRLAPLALVLVVVATFAWAYAFTRIYTRPHTRVTAARWLLQHAPPHATMTFELWDDRLPFFAGHYNPLNISFPNIVMNPYTLDEPRKFTGESAGEGDTQEPALVDVLDRANYIILSSNRAYGAISRLPMRYPVMMRYYHSLFNGELGFELAADITSYPSLLGIAIPDQAAEEAFTVYDHPRVLIFRKTPAFSRAHAAQLLTGGVNWDEIYPLPVQAADRAPTALRFTEREWSLYRHTGTWSNLFDPGNFANRAAPLVWFVVLRLLGLAMFALLFPLLPRMPDRGWSLAYVLGVLVVAYGTWLSASMRLLPFTPQSAWLVATLLLVAGAWAEWRARREIARFWAMKRTALLTAEVLFLVAFGGMLVLRWLNPNLWHPADGGDNLAWLAYLNAVVKSPTFPPYDPWFAGGFINDHYFGSVIVATLVHLTGIVPRIAFHLALPTFFALAAVGSWGVVYNLLAPAVRTRRGKPGKTPPPPPPVSSAERQARLSALLAPLFVLLFGSLAQAVGGGTGAFPLSTFLLADLSPRLVVLAFSLALLGVVVALVRHMPGLVACLKPDTDIAIASRRTPYRFIVLLLLAGLLVGTLHAIHLWDYGTYMGLTILTLGVAAVSYAGRGTVPWWQGMLAWLAAVVLIVVTGWVLFLPFTSHLATDAYALELLPRDSDSMRMATGDVLRLYGVWLFVTMSGGLLLAYRWLRQYRQGWIGAWAGAGVASFVVVLAVSGVLFATDALVLLLFLLVGAGVLAWHLRNQPPRRTLPLWWVAAALLICAVSTIVVGAGRVGRMEMSTSLSIHVWTLFALASAVVLPWVWAGRIPLVGRASTPRTATRRRAALARGAWQVWRAGAVVLLLASLAYPVTAIRTHISNRAVAGSVEGAGATRGTGKWAPSLDGAAFMRADSASGQGSPLALAEDWQAIAWLHQHIPGTPIVLEGHAPSSRWTGRIAAFTGLPTLLGWEHQQRRQRSVTNTIQWYQFNLELTRTLDRQSVIEKRKDAIGDIYNSTNIEETLRLLKQYAVEYVYIGGLERAIYPAAGLATFEQMAQQGSLQRVFRVGETAIYRVLNPGSPSAILTSDMPLHAPTRDTPPPLRLKQPVNDLPAVDEYAWNELANLSSWTAVLFWLVALYVLLLLGLPMAVVMFGQWRDGGIAWARLIGLLLAGYATWLPTSLRIWHYNLWGLAGGVVVLLLLNLGVIAWLGRRNAGAPGAATGVWAAFWRGLRVLDAHVQQHRGALLISEGVFLAGFALFATIRAYNPDLWHPIWGGEKPMELAFLNAILRSPVMPPYSPFFSDGYINYYYYGLYLVSLPIKATGIAPAIAFNLVIPTLFAMTLAGGYTLVAQITGRVRYGLIGAAFLTLLGNFAGVFKTGWSAGIGPVWNYLFNQFDPRPFLERLIELGLHPPLTEWYIGPSRVIVQPFTINEFPFWSFLFADLHPHMIALPIVLLMIAVLYRLLSEGEEVTEREGDEATGTTGATGRTAWYVYLFAALVLGTLAATNSWDFPTYTVLTGMVLVGKAWRTPQHGNHAAARPLLHLVARLAVALLLTLAIAIGGMAFYSPFFEHYHAFVSGIGLVEDGIKIGDYLVINGLFVAVLLPVFVGGAWRAMVRQGGDGTRATRATRATGVTGATERRSNEATGTTGATGRGSDGAKGGVTDKALPSRWSKTGRLLVAGPFVAVLASFVLAMARQLGGVFARSSRPAALVGMLLHGAFFALFTPVVAAVKRHWNTWQVEERPAAREVSKATITAAAATGDTTAPPAAVGGGWATPAPAAQHERQRRRRRVSPALSSAARSFLIVAAVFLAVLALRLPVVGLHAWLVALLLMGGGLLLSRRIATATWFTVALATLAWAVSLGIEVVYIRDHLAGGEAYRMNTVFKFGMQIWVLLALAAAASLPRLVRGLRRLGRDMVTLIAGNQQRASRLAPYRQLARLTSQAMGVLVLLVLVLAAAVFPVIGTFSRIGNRFALSPPPTLNGLAFLRYAEFVHNGTYVDLRPDGDAIAWLNEQIVGTSIIVQSSLGYYREYGVRVAANTGLPTVVSPLHENEQRDPVIVGIRDGDVDRLYRTTDGEAALQVLQKYDVNYVYVGSVERAFYPPEGVQKFETMMAPFLEPVYQTPGVTIYEVVRNPHDYPRPEPYLSDRQYQPSTPGTSTDITIPQDVRELEQKVADYPTNGPLVFELALRYRDMGKIDDALRILEVAANANPADIGLHHLWGDILAQAGRYQEAEEVYTNAALISNTSADWDKLGRELLRWGELDKAELALIRALTLEPVDPSAHYHLGQLYHLRKETDKARKHLSLYLELAPDGFFSAEARQLLETLKGNGNEIFD
jgi:uncharacterized membrane protein/Flp pilus assembly protein TadD